MGKSSKDKRDSYYRLAKEQGYRARSAFKLLQLNEQFNLFPTVDYDLVNISASVPSGPPAPSPPSTSTATTSRTTLQKPTPTRIIDLCAAPGSWSQVLSRHLSPLSTPTNPITIIALDLQPMTPLPGVITLQADITHPSTLPLVLHHLRTGSASSSTLSTNTSNTTTTTPLADLILSDGAPDVTGLHDLDEYIQSQLLLSALTLSACLLRPGGTFVAKIFRGRDVGVLFIKLRCLFDKVTVAKPRSSRGSSVEAFVVCEGFMGGELGGLGFEGSSTGSKNSTTMSTLEEQMIHWRDRLEGLWEPSSSSSASSPYPVNPSTSTSTSTYIAPFLACGDLSSWDSDATYQLDEILPKGEKRESIDPVQKPTAPPYKTALEMRRVMAGELKGRERAGAVGRKGGNTGKTRNAGKGPGEKEEEKGEWEK